MPLTRDHDLKPSHRSQLSCVPTLIWMRNRQKQWKQSSRPPMSGYASLTGRNATLLEYQHFNCQCRLSAASTRRSSTILTISGMTASVISCLNSASAFGSITVRPSTKSNTPFFSSLSSLMFLTPQSILTKGYHLYCLLLISLRLRGTQILIHTGERGVSHVRNLQSAHARLQIERDRLTIKHQRLRAAMKQPKRHNLP